MEWGGTQRSLIGKAMGRNDKNTVLPFQFAPQSEMVFIEK